LEIFKPDFLDLSFEIKDFSELSLYELHDLYKLRIAVFVIEQDCPYPEVDGLDIYCFHLLVKSDSEIIGCCRIIPPNVLHKEWSIGRFLVDKTFRRKKIASKILTESINFISQKSNEGTFEIRIDALKYLEMFYLKYNFVPIKEYIEYNWEYVEMLLVQNK
jgi:ElaA protein